MSVAYEDQSILSEPKVKDLMVYVLMIEHTSNVFVDNSTESEIKGVFYSHESAVAEAKRLKPFYHNFHYYINQEKVKE